MVELVYTADLKSAPFQWVAGSSPAARTTCNAHKIVFYERKWAFKSLNGRDVYAIFPSFYGFIARQPLFRKLSSVPMISRLRRNLLRTTAFALLMPLGIFNQKACSRPGKLLQPLIDALVRVGRPVCP